MANGAMRALVLIFLILYIVSPVDAVPGPVDDLILFFLYSMAGE